MISNNVLVLIVVGSLMAFLSDYVVVCEVDPSDTNSILLEQLRIQVKQLDANRDVTAKQLEIQRQQLDLLAKILQQQNNKTPAMEIVVSVSCTILGCAALYFVRKFIMYLRLRYNLSPEMPQTTELMDFAHPQLYQVDAERMRSVQGMKSPTDYFSCESGEE